MRKTSIKEEEDSCWCFELCSQGASSSTSLFQCFVPSSCACPQVLNEKPELGLETCQYLDCVKTFLASPRLILSSRRDSSCSQPADYHVDWYFSLSVYVVVVGQFQWPMTNCCNKRVGSNQWPVGVGLNDDKQVVCL